MGGAGPVSLTSEIIGFGTCFTLSLYSRYSPFCDLPWFWKFSHDGGCSKAFDRHGCATVPAAPRIVARRVADSCLGFWFDFLCYTEAGDGVLCAVLA
jgi:hypothetical protein